MTLQDITTHSYINCISSIISQLPPSANKDYSGIIKDYTIEQLLPYMTVQEQDIIKAKIGKKLSSLSFSQIVSQHMQNRDVINLYTYALEHLPEQSDINCFINSSLLQDSSSYYAKKKVINAQLVQSCLSKDKPHLLHKFMNSTAKVCDYAYIIEQLLSMPGAQSNTLKFIKDNTIWEMFLSSQEDTTNLPIGDATVGERVINFLMLNYHTNPGPSSKALLLEYLTRLHQNCIDTSVQNIWESMLLQTKNRLNIQDPAYIRKTAAQCIDLIALLSKKLPHLDLPRQIVGNYRPSYEHTHKVEVFYLSQMIVVNLLDKNPTLVTLQKQEIKSNIHVNLIQITSFFGDSYNFSADVYSQLSKNCISMLNKYCTTLPAATQKKVFSCTNLQDLLVNLEIPYNTKPLELYNYKTYFVPVLEEFLLSNTISVKSKNSTKTLKI